MSGNRFNSVLELPAPHRAAAARKLAVESKTVLPPTVPAPDVTVNKYRNKKAEYDGLQFDSVKEMHRYQFLKMQFVDGAITDFCRQWPLQIIVNGQYIAEYIADFTYLRGGVRVIEDVKSKATKKLPEYRLKVKLIKALYGYEVQEI